MYLITVLMAVAMLDYFGNTMPDMPGVQNGMLNGSPVLYESGSLYVQTDSGFEKVPGPDVRGAPVVYQGNVYTGQNLSTLEDGSSMLSVGHEQPGWTRGFNFSGTPEFRNGAWYIPDDARMANDSPQVVGSGFRGLSDLNKLGSVATEIAVPMVIGGNLAGGLGAFASAPVANAGSSALMAGAMGGNPITAAAGSYLGGMAGDAARGLGSIGQGAVQGAVGSAISGGNPLMGAATGAASGAFSSSPPTETARPRTGELYADATQYLGTTTDAPVFDTPAGENMGIYDDFLSGAMYDPAAVQYTGDNFGDFLGGAAYDPAAFQYTGYTDNFDDFLGGAMPDAAAQGYLTAPAVPGEFDDFLGGARYDPSIQQQLNLVALGGGNDAMSKLLGLGKPALAALGLLRADGSVDSTKAMQMLGRAAPGLLGAYASNQQSDALREIAQAQREAESGRYADIVRRDDSRYADAVQRERDAIARQDRYFMDLLGRDDTRYQTAMGREDAAIARQRGDIEFGRNVGAPSRQRYESSFDPNFNIEGLPGLKSAVDLSMNSALRGLSTQGNPYDNPSGLAEATKFVTDSVALPELNRYRQMNAQTGGFSAFSGSGATVPGINSGLPTGSGPGTQFVPGLGSNLPTGASAGSGVGTGGGSQALIGSVGQDANMWNSLGAAAGDVFTPRRSVTDLLRELGNVRY